VIEQWIDSACAGGLISASQDQYRTLSLTPLGREVMAGRVSDVRMNVPVQPKASKRKRARRRERESEAGILRVDTRVEEALRAWRLAEARSRGIAAFVVLHDRTLTAIAAELPDSVGTLAAVPGIGPAKLEAYGESILTVVRSTLRIS
jgi:ATP-dependent DNA helicase RecQ